MTLPEEPGKPQPLPNKADDSWAELERLRDYAGELGIKVDQRWSVARLREEIAAAEDAS